MCSALQISKKLLKFAEIDTASDGDFLSNLKLQKLLYYAQGFHLAVFDTPLFSDKIEAWMYGPVVPAVYEHYKDFGCNGIYTPIKQGLVKLKKDEEDLLYQVYNRYKSFSALGLVELTHSEPPWINANPKGRGTVISTESMKSFFKQQLNA